MTSVPLDHASGRRRRSSECGRADDVARHDRLLGVLEDALRAARSAARLHRGVDLVLVTVASRAMHVRSTTEPSGTGTRIAMPSSLPLSSGIDQPDRLRGAGRRRDHVQRRGARAPQVLVRQVEDASGRSCRRASSSSGRARCRTRRAAPWRPARGSSSCTTRSRRCWCFAGSYVVVVDAEHERRVGVLGGRRDDHLRGAGGEVLRRRRRGS